MTEEVRSQVLAASLPEQDRKHNVKRCSSVVRSNGRGKLSAAALATERLNRGPRLMVKERQGRRSHEANIGVLVQAAKTPAGIEVLGSSQGLGSLSKVDQVELPVVSFDALEPIDGTADIPYVQSGSSGEGVKRDYAELGVNQETALAASGCGREVDEVADRQASLAIDKAHGTVQLGEGDPRGYTGTDNADEAVCRVLNDTLELMPVRRGHAGGAAGLTELEKAADVHVLADLQDDLRGEAVQDSQGSDRS